MCSCALARAVDLVPVLENYLVALVLDYDLVALVLDYGLVGMVLENDLVALVLEIDLVEMVLANDFAWVLENDFASVLVCGLVALMDAVNDLDGDFVQESLTVVTVHSLHIGTVDIVVV